MTDQVRIRGIGARIDICALNILFPGLGLLRLARYRLAIVFGALSYGMTLPVAAVYAGLEHLSFGLWLSVIAVFLSGIVIVFAGSIIASWRASRLVAPRKGHLWRWYGVAGTWMALTAASYALPDSRSFHRSYRIASDAMAPTLRDGDLVMGDMHAIDPIRRGDIVIVWAHGQAYVRRVAGIPGDRIAMSRGLVVLNGTPVAQEFVGKTTGDSADPDGAPIAATIARERFPGEAGPHLVRDLSPMPEDDALEVALPPSRFFLLGDNRDESFDSRSPSSSYGLDLVPRQAIIGKFEFRYWRGSKATE